MGSQGSGVYGRRGDSPLAPDWCGKRVCEDLGKACVGDPPYPLAHFGKILSLG